MTDYKEKKKQLDKQKTKDNYITISKILEALKSDVITTNLSDINRLKKDEFTSKFIN